MIVTMIAEYATKPSRPVARYGQQWDPPLEGEKLVHYIWRHKPSDFEERYMARMDDPESLPSGLDFEVAWDAKDEERGREPRTDGNGHFLPPPMNPHREGQIERRTNPWPQDLDPERLRYEGTGRGTRE